MVTIQQLVKNEGLVCLEREVDEILPKDTKMGRMVFAVFEMTVRIPANSHALGVSLAPAG